MNLWNIEKGKGELVYCATPSRLILNNSGIINNIMDFVSKKGYAPFHPFQAFPFEYFEGNDGVGKDLSMKYCKKAVLLCSQFWLLGCSDGTVLIELPLAIQEKKTIKFVKEFDPFWEQHLQEYANKSHVLEQLLKK